MIFFSGMLRRIAVASLTPELLRLPHRTLEDMVNEWAW